MNLISYKKFYVINEDHWYVSKIKQFSEESISQLSKGLFLFYQLFSSDSNTKLRKQFLEFVKIDQIKIFDDPNNFSAQIPFFYYSELFLSLNILVDNLVDLSHLKVTNKKKYLIFNNIRNDFKLNNTADFIIRKYGRKYLNDELNVYARNFYSWLSKFGFIGISEKNQVCFFTEAGLEFLKGADDIDISSAIFLNQIKKLQVWNPTISIKYKNIRVIPFYLILQILIKLPENYFTKLEYVLFITKIKNHSEQEINNAVELIKLFRELSKDEKNKYVSEINKLDYKLFPLRRRTNFERLSDSYIKEIGAYTFSGYVRYVRDNNEIKHVLENTKLVTSELNKFEKSVQYIDFTSKIDWIRHLGNLNGLTVEDILEVYLRQGKSKEEIKKLFENSEIEIEEIIEEKLFENQIENYYIKHLEEIDKDLEIVESPHHGKQFPTHIGYIDLLCRNKLSNEFVVIEFKRSQVSDDTIGQILRYMGWIYMNLSSNNSKVKGIIVGNNFTEKFHYSFIGIQSNQIFEIIKLFPHNFDIKNKPII